MSDTIRSPLAALPYDSADYAAHYDDVYLLSGVNAGQTAFELAMVSRIAERHPSCSWLDVGCGTGYHLRNAVGPDRRVGVDRAQAMLDVAISRPGRTAGFHRRDGRDLASLGRFDLVTPSGTATCTRRTSKRLSGCSVPWPRPWEPAAACCWASAILQACSTACPVSRRWSTGHLPGSTPWSGATQSPTARSIRT